MKCLVPILETMTVGQKLQFSREETAEFNRNMTRLWQRCSNHFYGQQSVQFFFNPSITNKLSQGSKSKTATVALQHKNLTEGDSSLVNNGYQRNSFITPDGVQLTSFSLSAWKPFYEDELLMREIRETQNYGNYSSLFISSKIWS